MYCKFSGVSDGLPYIAILLSRHEPSLYSIATAGDEEGDDEEDEVEDDEVEVGRGSACCCCTAALTSLRLPFNTVMRINLAVKSLVMILGLFYKQGCKL